MHDLQIHLIHCDLLTIDSTWDTRNVCSTFWRFYINNRDGASIWWAGGRYPLPAGRVHLIPAYVRFSCQNQSPIEHLYAHFDLVGLPPVLQKQLLARPFSLKPAPIHRQLHARYAQGHRPESDPLAMCLTHSSVFESLAAMLNQLPADAYAQLAGFCTAPNPLRPALQLVEQRLPEPIAVPEMAGACGLSADHFIRQFRKLMQQTPARYVLQRRLALAARRLLYSEDSIDQIALSHGFANRFHFTRAFSREMGTTPAAYRTTSRV